MPNLTDVDSTPPLARSVYVAQEADWGDHQWHGQEYQGEQWYDDDYQEYAIEQQDADNIEIGEEHDEEAYMGQDGYDSEEVEEHQLLTLDDDSEGEEDDDDYE
jgi:hypothetical protein